ncbi:LysR family transcriptional regulator [Paraburkholderia silvatlantica]|uniref:DNA-binding transcriptional LysR family regulator n=1 Tax=Paraburkholderia silvatlantica TaxID=321895 RepID=A0ABR6FQC1_9BURK|nr:LysR family transcriptional regulator [Paraburkholderia silvatlantica]MBB2929010.1 DNA-binding transcriptional LysR family regulator [Paraburkholderia silvatlantica]
MLLPTVSWKVTELEEYLGTKLLHRSTRKLTLTDAGQACVESAKRMMEDLRKPNELRLGEYITPRGARAAAAQDESLPRFRSRPVAIGYVGAG